MQWAGPSFSSFSTRHSALHSLSQRRYGAGTEKRVEAAICRWRPLTRGHRKRWFVILFAKISKEGLTMKLAGFPLLILLAALQVRILSADRRVEAGGGVCAGTGVYGVSYSLLGS